MLLVASHGGRSVGFKVGYADPDRLKHFHSWLGGVLPAYRRQGIAWKMLQQQEEWAQSQGFQTIGFNTFDRYPASLEGTLLPCPRVPDRPNKP